MSINVLVMVHSPDADSEMHRSMIDTGKFKLWSVVVKDQPCALNVAKSLAAEHQIDSIMLCPGFTHSGAVEIFDSLHGEVGMSVARGDGLSNKIAAQARARTYGGG